MNPLVRFRINKPNVVYEVFDDELVLINLDSGNYYSFEKVGADVWELVQSGATVTEIIEGVFQRYEGSHSTMENAVHKFLKELQEEELILPDETKEAKSVSGPYQQNKCAGATEKPDFETPVLHKYTDMQDFLLVDPIHEIDYTNGPEKKPK